MVSRNESLIAKLDRSLPPEVCASAGRQLLWFLRFRGRHYQYTGRIREAAFYPKTKELEGLPATQAIGNLLLDMVEMLEPEREVIRVKAIANHPYFRGNFHSDVQPGRRLIGNLRGEGSLELAGTQRGARFVDGQLPRQGIIPVTPGEIVAVDNTPPLVRDREQHRFVNGATTRVALLIGDESPILAA